MISQVSSRVGAGRIFVIKKNNEGITPTPTPTPTIHIPDNDFVYLLLPNNDLTYTLIPANDLIDTLIPDNDLLFTLVPNGELTYVLLPDNDVNYTLIPNTDLTYTLIPNNDVQYTVLKPPTTFFGLIKIGEGMDVCNGGPEYTTFYVTGDGPTFCESTNFVSNGFIGLNGYISAYYGGYVMTINVNGTDIGTQREVCSPCPTPEPFSIRKIVNLNINDYSSYSYGLSTITDLLGGTNASLINSPSYSNGSGCGSNITLDGTTQFIITDTSLSNYYTISPNPSDTSVFLWVYLTDNGVILSEQGSTSLNTSWHDSQIELVNGSLRFSVWPLTNVITSSISTPLNNWHYIGFTYSGTTLTAYVNGQNAGTTSFVRETPYQNNNNLYYAIGAEDTTTLGDGSYSSLIFGQLEIWNGSISSSDVLTNYNNNVNNWICH
jgi:hypothetical protein